jgi:hypothetical protein
MESTEVRGEDQIAQPTRRKRAREGEMGVRTTLEQGEVASDDGGIDDGVHWVGHPYVTGVSRG